MEDIDRQIDEHHLVHLIAGSGKEDVAVWLSNGSGNAVLVGSASSSSASSHKKTNGNEVRLRASENKGWKWKPCLLFVYSMRAFGSPSPFL